MGLVGDWEMPIEYALELISAPFFVPIEYALPKLIECIFFEYSVRLNRESLATVLRQAGGTGWLCPSLVPTKVLKRLHV